MTKHRRNESMNMFRDHVDPEKEDQHKHIILETDAKVERIIKLVKSVSSGNKEAKQRKRSEIVNLIEDLHKQYQFISGLYEDLKEGVKRKCNNINNNNNDNIIEEDKEDNESNSSSNSLSMESAGYYSPGSGSKIPNYYQNKVTSTTNSMKSENSSYSMDELSVLSSSTTVENPVKVLEDKVSALKVEIESINCQISDHEVEFKGRHDTFDVKDDNDDKDENVLKKVDDKIEESIDRVQSLKHFLHGKEKELETLRIENQEKEIKLEKKAKEVVNIQETLTEKLKEKTSNEEGLVEERNILKEHVKDLEIKIETLSNDTRPAPVKDLSNKMKSLQQKFESLEVDKRELEGKNDGDTLVNRLGLEPKSSLQTTVRKMGEMVDEFRKKSEDSYRILNRRVCVAEQLNNETHGWYKRTLDKHEQDKKDCDLAIHSIKAVTSMVSETLSVSETFGLRFVECCEEFTNRVSKVSCEINFVKDWVKRKNGELIQVKENFDALVVQMNNKEEEILWSRQKALRLENKLRDLEKIVKENDEAMIVLKEEKREAIRQLCVWIDHHRSRSDFLKKAFYELASRCQRAC